MRVFYDRRFLKEVCDEVYRLDREGVSMPIGLICKCDNIHKVWLKRYFV